MGVKRSLNEETQAIKGPPLLPWHASPGREKGT